MRLLQFTDLHLRDDPAAEVRGVQAQRSFEQVLYHAQQHHWPADAILLTGDLAHDEFESTYSRLAEMSRAWNAPVIAVPGNHDDPVRLRTSFPGNRIADSGNWRIIGIDSHQHGMVGGRVSEQEWCWIETAMQVAAHVHVLVAVHHPPLGLHSEWLDRIGLENAEAFRALLERQGVKCCLFGHAHQAWSETVNGVRYLGTPSTCRQFEPRSENFAESDAPPAYRWIQLHDDGGISSEVVWVEC